MTPKPWAWCPNNLGEAQKYAGAIWIPDGEVITSMDYPMYLSDRIEAIVQKLPENERMEAVRDLEEKMRNQGLGFVPEWMTLPNKWGNALYLLIAENPILKDALSLMEITDHLPIKPVTRHDPEAKEILENDDLSSWVENLIIP